MYSGKSCCCGCGNKPCDGNEYFYENTNISCPICAVGVSSHSLSYQTQTNPDWPMPGTEPKHNMAGETDDLFIGESCWSSDMCGDYHECIDDMTPPHYYQMASPMGFLPWSPQSFSSWIDNYGGPLVPKGNCTMHCTEENIGCHRIAFSGSIGRYHEGELQITMPPYPEEDFENWQWIRNWVLGGGKLVIMYGGGIFRNPREDSWNGMLPELDCYLNCPDEQPDTEYPSGTDDWDEEGNLRMFAHFCATRDDETEEPIGPGFEITNLNEFYSTDISYDYSDYINVPSTLPDDSLKYCCQKTTKPFEKSQEDSGGNHMGNIPFSFHTHNAWPLWPKNEGIGVVGACNRAPEPPNENLRGTDACTVVYKQNGKGAVIVVYDDDVWGISAVSKSDTFYTFINNGLTIDENKLLHCNNDFWTFLCQDFLEEEGYSPSGCPEPIFWDNKGPDYEGNECVPKAACCKPDGTCEDLNVWECGKIPLSIHHGCDGEGPSCNTCMDIGSSCEEIKKGACCHCEDGSCPEPSDDDGGGEQPFEHCLMFGNVCIEGIEKCCYGGRCIPKDDSCEDITIGEVCWPKETCSAHEPCDIIEDVPIGWPLCDNEDCCEFVCRGWFWDEFGPHHTHQNMDLVDYPGINPFYEKHIDWMKIICENAGELLYDNDDALIGITWPGGDDVLGNQTYGVMEIEPCNYMSGGFSHQHPWLGWTGDYKSISWQEIEDEGLQIQDSRNRVASYTCGYWSSHDTTCKPPEEHPDWNTLIHGHAATTKYVNGELTPCNGFQYIEPNPVSNEYCEGLGNICEENEKCCNTGECVSVLGVCPDGEIVLDQACGYPLDYANWGCDGCCTPYGSCCTGYWLAYEPLVGDSSPEYEVGIGSTADGHVYKGGCGTRRQFDCDSYMPYGNWITKIRNGVEYNYGTKWTASLFDGEEKHFYHHKSCCCFDGCIDNCDNQPTLCYTHPEGVTYDAWIVNEWHGITDGSPKCNDGTSWLPYEKVDDIIRGSEEGGNHHYLLGETGSICYHCEFNSDCPENECCTSVNNYYEFLPQYQKIVHDRMCMPCDDNNVHDTRKCDYGHYTPYHSFKQHNPYGCGCFAGHMDCCQCQSTNPNGVGINGVNNYDPNCDCHCMCQASDPDGENYDPSCNCEGLTGEGRPYCTGDVAEEWDTPGNWPPYSDYKCVECLLDSHCPEDKCCRFGHCIDPEEVKCWSDDDCCLLAPCCSAYPTPCDGIEDPMGTCSVCQECNKNEDCFDHHCCNNGTCGSCIPCAPGSSGGCLPGRGWNEPCQESGQCAGDLCCRDIVPGEIHGRCWDCEGINPYTQPCEPCGFTGPCCVKGLTGPTSIEPVWECHDKDGEGLRWLECRNVEVWDDETSAYSPSDNEFDYKWTRQIDRCGDELFVEVDGELIEIECETDLAPNSDAWFKPGRLDWDGDCLPCQSNCPYGFYCSLFGPTGSYPASGLIEDPRVCRPYDDFCWSSGDEGMTFDNACNSCNVEVIPDNYNCVQCSGEYDFDEYDGITGDCQVGCSTESYVIVDGATGACCIRGYNHPNVGICEDLTYDGCLAKGRIEENYGDADIAWYGINMKCDDVIPEEGKLCPKGYCCDCDTPEHNHPPEPSMGWGLGSHGPLWPEYGCDNTDDWHYNDGITGDPWRFTQPGYIETSSSFYPQNWYATCAEFEDPDDFGYSAPKEIECESYCCGVSNIMGGKYDEDDCSNNFNNYCGTSFCEEFGDGGCSCCYDGTLMDGKICGEVRYCGDYISPVHLSDIAKWNCECGDEIWRDIGGFGEEYVLVREDSMNCFCPFNCLANQNNPCIDEWPYSDECGEDNLRTPHSFDCTGACSSPLGACCHEGIVQVLHDEGNDNEGIGAPRRCRIMSKSDCEALSIVSWEYYIDEDNNWPAEPDNRQGNNQITYFYEGMWCDEIPEESPCMDYSEKIKCHECNHDGDCISSVGNVFGQPTPSCRENEFGIRKCERPISCSQPNKYEFEWCEDAGNICEEDEKCCYNRLCVPIEDDCECLIDCYLSGNVCCGLNGDCGGCEPYCDVYDKCCGNIIHEVCPDINDDNCCTRQKRLAGECCNEDTTDGGDGCLSHEYMAMIRVFPNVCTDCLGECYASGHHTGSVIKPNTTMYDEEYLLINDDGTNINIYDCCWRCKNEEPLGNNWHFNFPPVCSADEWVIDSAGSCDINPSCCSSPAEGGPTNCCPDCGHWQCVDFINLTCEDVCVNTEHLHYDPTHEQCQTCECLHIKAEYLGHPLCPDTGACFDHTCYPKWYGDVGEGQCDGGGCGLTGECIPASYLSYEHFEVVGDFPAEEWICHPNFDECELYDGITESYVWLDENLPNLNGSICGEIDNVPIMPCDDCGARKIYDPCHSNGPTAGFLGYYNGQYGMGNYGHWVAGMCIQPDGECGPCSDFCAGCGPCGCETDDDCEEDLCCMNNVCKVCVCYDDDDCEGNMCCVDEQCIECGLICDNHDDCEENMCCNNERCAECILCEMNADCWQHGLCCGNYVGEYKVCEECNIECVENWDCPFGLCCGPDELTGLMGCMDCTDVEDECSCLGEMYEYECCMQSDNAQGNMCWKEDEGCNTCTP